MCRIYHALRCVNYLLKWVNLMLSGQYLSRIRYIFGIYFEFFCSEFFLKQFVLSA
jgi:hypothetical protein